MTTMLSAIRRRLTYANVAVTLVLVFAMSGGAYAASRYVITSTKQIKPSVLKALQDKAGPAGAPGVKGETGAGGTAGAAGANGTNGANGQSVTSAEFSGSKGGCKVGGSEFTAANGKTFACNGKEGKEGKEGPPGPLLETLPAGKTLRGAWSAASLAVEEKALLGAYNGVATTSVSYDFPLSGKPEAHFIKVGEAPPAGCAGSVKEPGAEEGNLCVFAAVEVNTPAEVTLPEDPTIGFYVSALANEKGPMLMNGSWAVTGE
jgi:hypothetical protein